MGSRNTNGSKIPQERQSIRNVGGAQVVSEDKVEQTVVKDGLTALGTQPAIQVTVTSNAEVQKVTNDATGSVSREQTAVAISPVGQNPPWVSSVDPNAGKIVAVERTSAQSIAHDGSGDGFVTWTTELRDDLGISTVGAGTTDKVATFTEPGVWDAKAQVAWSASTVGLREIGIRLFNSSDVLIWSGYVRHNPTQDVSFTAYQNVSDTFRVSTGDYVKVSVYQTSGGPLNIGVTSIYTHCTLTYIGR